MSPSANQSIHHLESRWTVYDAASDRDRLRVLVQRLRTSRQRMPWLRRDSGDPVLDGVCRCSRLPGVCMLREREATAPLWPLPRARLRTVHAVPRSWHDRGRPSPGARRDGGGSPCAGGTGSFGEIKQGRYHRPDGEYRSRGVILLRSIPTRPGYARKGRRTRTDHRRRCPAAPPYRGSAHRRQRHRIAPPAARRG